MINNGSIILIHIEGVEPSESTLGNTRRGSGHFLSLAVTKTFSKIAFRQLTFSCPTGHSWQGKDPAFHRRSRTTNPHRGTRDP
ncbi:hypothetical protein CH063_16042 [Colletotrichum higginsianum]|uniref:Uncharacterized protein n=1 Tax=Colletotrichum higginsianum (strain IMI 349063) TaxID=759273 RepID=H1W5P0_COLHI|nr:hypothetical protein CH063_16042 [Colletotrichum higginsianum]